MNQILKALNNWAACAIFFVFVFTTIVKCSGNQSDTDTEKPSIETATASVAPPNWFCSTIEIPETKTSRAVGGKTKFWATGTVLKIGFFNATASQIATVKTHAAEWVGPGAANLTFTYPSAGPYDIRIGVVPALGAWSYVGNDAKLVSQTSVTMNLGWIASDVIKHEFGHALGLYHEHQNPNGGICWNETNVITSLSGPPNNWSVAQIRFNVLDRIDPTTVLTTPWDRVSIMHYNIPSNWTCNNVSIPGGTTISQNDKDFIRARYPGVVVPSTGVTLTASQVDNIIALLNARKIESDTNAARLNRTIVDVKKILNR